MLPSPGDLFPRMCVPCQSHDINGAMGQLKTSTFQVPYSIEVLEGLCVRMRTCSIFEAQDLYGRDSLPVFLMKSSISHALTDRANH